jgi:hypothetical protein
VILFSPSANGGLFRIGASGGQAVQVSELNKSRGELGHRFPHFLPDGNHFLYLAVGSKPEDSAIYVGSLDSKETTRLVASSVKAEFSPPDLLLFLRESTLMAHDLIQHVWSCQAIPFKLPSKSHGIRPMA